MGKGQSGSHLKLNVVLFAESLLKSLQILPRNRFESLPLALGFVSRQLALMAKGRRGCRGTGLDHKAGGNGLIPSKDALETSWK